ncbi:MAG: isochorismate synthase [Myxococcota bacterium]
MTLPPSVAPAPSVASAPSVTLPPSVELDLEGIEAARSRLQSYCQNSDPHSSEGTRLLVCTIEAPLVRPERLLSFDESQDAVVWLPKEGPSAAALGSVWSCAGVGSARFASVRQQAKECFAKMCFLGPEDGGDLRMFGGFAFAPGGAEQSSWSPYGDASFTLPELTYVVERGRALLSLVVNEDRLSPEIIDEKVGRLTFAMAHLSFASEVQKSGDAAFALEDEAECSFIARVKDILSGIEAGELSKVVAARRASLRCNSMPRPETIIHNLSERYPDCTRFVFRRSGRLFVGATPERLVQKRAREVYSQALAGSSAAEAKQTLLSSDKDLREHQMVVDAIVAELRPRCVRVIVDPAPGLLELQDVAHLQTLVRGQLRERSHIVDLVDALHPTPAVGGVPKERAQQLIAREEPASRGWYSGPIGWLDANGDGDFWVALRSCLVHGDRAFVYAGAGIVAGSVPELEYSETELKMRAVMRALPTLRKKVDAAADLSMSAALDAAADL